MDPFQVLGIDRRYAVDLARLDKTHRELSRALHPDRFTAAPPGEKRAALSKAVEVNEAFRVVRDPVRRAEALFAAHGVAVGEAREPKASPAFLMDVLERREALADAKVEKDAARVRALEAEVRTLAAGAEAALAAGFDRLGEKEGGADLAALVPVLGELRFYRRFLEEAQAVLDEWDDGAL